MYCNKCVKRAVIARMMTLMMQYYRPLSWPITTGRTDFKQEERVKKSHLQTRLKHACFAFFPTTGMMDDASSCFILKYKEPKS